MPTDEKTPEEIAAELWYSLSDLDEEIIAGIAAVIREAEERGRQKERKAIITESE